MFSTINRKFYTIAGILVLLFSLGYTVVAFFLHQQGQSAIREQEAVFIDREIRSLHDLFFEIRFWDRTVFFQDHPEADKKFGALLEQLRKRLMILNSKPVSVDIKEMLEKVSKFLTEYEKDFNNIIQLKTEQRLYRTRMDASYRSLSSNVLRSNEHSLLKPFFILTHFQKGYHIFRRETEYQALKVAIDSFGRKFLLANLMDERMKDYLKAFSDLLDQDFSLERQIRLITVRFDQISTQLMDLFSTISREAERSLRNEFKEAEESRNELNVLFLISTVLSIMILMVILIVMAMKIIRPIRSMANVMREVKTGNIGARFDSVGNKNDEVMQLGWSFNDMLNTVEENNQQLVSYQDELENKVSELGLRETELKRHREDLEVLVAERTADLTKAAQGLQQEIIERRWAEDRIAAALKEKEVLLREIHHRVKNNMQVIISLLRLQSDTIKDQQYADMFQESQERIKSMALIHEKLYQSKDLARVDFNEYIKSLLNGLFRSHGIDTGRIVTKLKVEDVSLGLDHAIPCGLIINELVSNSLKYAFPEDRKGEIGVTLRSNTKGEIELWVSDDGIGIPEDLDFRKTDSLGLDLVTILAEDQLEGKIDLDRTGGTTFRILFKGKI